MCSIRWGCSEVGIKVRDLDPRASGWEDEAKGKVSHDQSFDGPGQFPLALVGVHGLPLLGSASEYAEVILIGFKDQVSTSTEALTNLLC